MSADSRLDLHMPRATKQVIERAAAIRCTTVSAFVIGLAERTACQVILDYWAREARDAEHRKFVALLNGPKPLSGGRRT